MNIKNQIVSWIKDYSNKSHVNTLVIGISGGIDSALTSMLCAETGLKTILFSMPIKQNKEQLKRAHNHISVLVDKYENVSGIEKDLTDVYEEFERTFSNISPNYLALANSRARLRMMSLYYIAQVNNGLVVGTGNKVEDFGVGFFTKYGDGGVDISPIADLTKTQVRGLAREMGIHQAILDAPPTDGLWDDSRTDEDQIGASYEELEWAMDYIENNRLYNLTLRQKEVIIIYKKFNRLNAHKMQAIPVCKIRSGENHFLKK